MGWDGHSGLPADLLGLRVDLEVDSWNFFGTCEEGVRREKRTKGRQANRQNNEASEHVCMHGVYVACVMCGQSGSDACAMQRADLLGGERGSSGSRAAGADMVKGVVWKEEEWEGASLFPDVGTPRCHERRLIKKGNEQHKSWK